MKIIIAGGGIGGMALAALLQQRGIVAEIYERAPNFDHSGYMLGLYPVGSRVLHGLGLMEEFLRVAQPMETYTICNGHGEAIHTYDLGAALNRFGYTGTLMRGDLIRLLRSRCEDAPLQFDTKVEDFSEHADGVTVALSNGEEKECDLLIGADGIHSAVRRKLFGVHPDHDTGWGCWVWILQGGARPPTTTTEYWGRGRLVGVYPVRDGFGIVAAGPTRLAGPEATERDGRKVREYFSAFGPAVADLLAGLPDDLTDIFWWKLSDYRCEFWTKGRVALMGDSACAFLPTAGGGASMALESAAVLADELGRTDARFAALALDHYEKRRKKRAEAFQHDSRKMAAMMAIESAPMAWGRDQLMKFYTLEMLVTNIFKSLADPI